MIRRLRTSENRPESRDDGFTLVEMLVAMLVFGVAMALVMSALLTLTRQTRNTLGRAESIQSARLGLSQIDRQVRSGNLFQTPTENGWRLAVFTQANGARKCVEWRVGTDGELRTRSWSPTWTTDGDVGAWTTYARGLVNDRNKDLNGDGKKDEAVFTVTTTGSSQPLLTVRLLIQDKNDRGKSVEVASTFSGRNTLFGYDPAVCQNVPTA